MPSESKTAAGRSWGPHRVALTAAYLALSALWLVMAIRGAEYYLTPPLERARHPLFWELKPGGQIGLLFGYVGAGMMTGLLLYSVRKRVRILRSLGALARWLDWHILLGVFGPLFIVLHSSLKVGGLVSISFWSMLTVAASGVFGRFLYQQIPRSKDGPALSLEEIEQERAALGHELEQLGPKAPDRLGDWQREIDQMVAQTVERQRSLLRLVVGLPWQGWVLRRRIRRASARWQVPAHLKRRAAQLAVSAAMLQRRLMLLQQLQRVFFYWHVFHKPFALIMYCLMVVHIGVAWATGYRGPFG